MTLKRILLGAGAVVASAGLGLGIAGAVSDDGSVPAKITNPGTKGDPIWTEAVATGWMPVAGGKGYVAMSDLLDPSHKAGTAWSLQVHAEARSDSPVVGTMPAGEGFKAAK